MAKMSFGDAKAVLQAYVQYVKMHWAGCSKGEKAVATFLIGLGVLGVALGPKMVNRLASLLWLLAGGVLVMSAPATHQQFVVMESGQQAQLTAIMVIEALDAYLRARMTGRS